MAINKETIQVNTTPGDLPNWVDAVRQSAVANGLLTLNTTTNHHIYPQNLIVAARRAAITATSETVLESVAKYASETKAVPNAGTDQDKLERLMERILWAFGNIIPGPPNVSRIDDPMGAGGWEAAGPFTAAMAFAKKLRDTLEAIAAGPGAGEDAKKRENRRFTQWRGLVDLVHLEGSDHRAAKQDILAWADAWGTHRTFRIYARLSADETRTSRRDHLTRAGFGAWVYPSHREIGSIGSQLETWAQTINASQGADKALAINRMVDAIKNGQARNWLTLHPV